MGVFWAIPNAQKILDRSARWVSYRDVLPLLQAAAHRQTPARQLRQEKIQLTSYHRLGQ